MLIRSVSTAVWRFLPLIFFAASYPAESIFGPLFLRSSPFGYRRSPASAFRTCPRATAPRRGERYEFSSARRCIEARQSCVVLLGGKSLGSCRHWQPVVSTYRIPLTRERRDTLRSGGRNGSIREYSSSVRSLSWRKPLRW